MVDDADVSPEIYFSLKPDDAVIEGDNVVDGDPVGGEKGVVDDSVVDQNLPPVEGWDPSWLYRTLTPGEGDGSEEIIVDQGTGWEDGLGCGVSPDGFVPGDVPSNDFDGNEMPDDFVINAFDPLPLEDDPGKPVDFIIDNDGVLEPVDGEVAVEVDAPLSDPNQEEVHYAFDPLPLDDVVGEPIDVVEDGELIPIRTMESSDFDPSIIYFTAAPGGIEVQRTNDAGNVQEESAAPSAVAIPIRPTSSNSVFNSNNGRSSVGIPAGVQANSAPGTNLSPAKRNATQRRSATQVAAARQSVASEGLNSLSPLLGGDEAQSENDSPENSVDTQAVESGSIEETVSDSGNASSSASGFAANQNIRSGRAAMIDRVMAQYAENSFNS
ncbi:MAG: hypothetical protein H7Z17_13570 [Fuerstia sp.]|nr:hypothetical protein [Fuerstiella sp.]